jgi:CHRD domain-containing protein/ferritin-like protein
MSKKYHGMPEEIKTPSRRTFLQQLLGTSLASAAGVALLPRASWAGKGPTTPPPPQGTGQQPPTQTGGTGKPVGGAQGGDLDVLNFALLLEQLEAAFYNQNAGKPYLTGSGTGQKGTSFAAQMNGASEVPAVNTAATGTSTFDLSQDQTLLSYSVQATGLSSPAIAMHLHRGAVGVPGDIVYTLNTPVNGTAVGATPLNPADLNTLLTGGFYINIHTSNYPGGEIRGQVLTTGSPGTGIPSGSTTLLAMVTEIRDHENQHVLLLQQALGGAAQPAPAFQNLDAPTLQQFLTMAQMFEDVGVSAYVGQVPNILDKGLLATVAGIMAVEGRHAGGIRAYRKGASTADGGDPNITLTEDREAVNRARTKEQVLALLQPYLGGTAVSPTNPTPVTPNPTTPSPY